MVCNEWDGGKGEQAKKIDSKSQLMGTHYKYLVHTTHSCDRTEQKVEMLIRVFLFRKNESEGGL